MLYVYKQFECPVNAAGVEVLLSVLDANGNYRTIGTTTSDANGKYSFDWTPDIAGKYTVYATFLGSGGYYGSVGQDAFIVKEAATPTTEPAKTPESMADQYFLPAIAGLFAAIIVCIVLVLMVLLRKRP
jgi:hypothetical protein